MGKCRYDLSEDCNKRDCLDCVLDKIKAEIIAKDRNVKAIRSDDCCFFTADEILNILNKYKAEKINENLSCDDMAENGLCRFCNDRDQCAADIDELSKEMREWFEEKA